MFRNEWQTTERASWPGEETGQSKGLTRSEDALVNHQKQHPEQLGRKYLVDKVHKIIEVDAPNDRTRRLLDCETDEDGVLRTFAPVNVPYTPEETAANILRHFHLTASTQGSPAHDQTITNEVTTTTVLPTDGTENPYDKNLCIDILIRQCD